MSVNEIYNLYQLAEKLEINTAKMLVLISALGIPRCNHSSYSCEMFDYKIVKRYLNRHGYFCGDYSDTLKEIM